MTEFEQAVNRAFEAFQKIQSAPRREIVYRQEGPRVYAMARHTDEINQVPEARVFPPKNRSGPMAKRKKPASVEEALRDGLKYGLFALAGVTRRAGAAVLDSVAKDVARTAREVDKRVRKFRDGLDRIVEMPPDEDDEEDEARNEWRRPQ
jgi:hypothetical protein